MHFVMPDGAKGKNTDPKHLAKYYSKFSEVINENYDGVIVTGAPVIYHCNVPSCALLDIGLLRTTLHWLSHADCVSLTTSPLTVSLTLPARTSWGTLQAMRIYFV